MAMLATSAEIKELIYIPLELRVLPLRRSRFTRPGL
jgi:hypothetical protein